VEGFCSRCGEKESRHFDPDGILAKHRTEEVIGAVIAGAEEAEALQTSAGSALLMIRETTYDAQNVAIEYSLSLLRGDRHTASVFSVRKN
jgi:DNA-binding GntR family transcriptional regulator